MALRGGTEPFGLDAETAATASPARVGGDIPARTAGSPARQPSVDKG